MIRNSNTFILSFIPLFFIVGCTDNTEQEKTENIPLTINTTYSAEYKEVSFIEIPKEITINNIIKQEKSKLYITLNNDDNILFIEPNVNSDYIETFILDHSGTNSPTEITINANKKETFKPKITLFDQDFNPTESFDVVRSDDPQTFYYHIKSFLNNTEFSYSHSDNVVVSLSESEIIIRYEGDDEDSEGTLTIRAIDSTGQENTLDITLNFIDQ